MRLAKALFLALAIVALSFTLGAAVSLLIESLRQAPL